MGGDGEFRKVLGVRKELRIWDKYLFMYFFPLLGEREFKA